MIRYIFILFLALITISSIECSAQISSPNKVVSSKSGIITGADQTEKYLPYLKGKRIAIIGDIMHSRVALSNIFCLQKQGAEVMVAGPPTLIPKHVESLGVKVEYDVKKALQWCEIANVLRIQLERQHKPLFSTLREYSLYYGINKSMLDALEKEVVIMHPGPINRGVELSSDAADSKQSIILDQVENGVAIRMAVIYLLSGKQGVLE